MELEQIARVHREIDALSARIDEALHGAPLQKPSEKLIQEIESCIQRLVEIKGRLRV